jgi:putative ABC transport system ATP-binding protein
MAMLELSQAGKTYLHQGIAVTALHPLSLSIGAGEFLCLSGPSGSGKTTLLNLMGIIDAPTTGAVILAGKRTGGLSRAQTARLRRQHLGLVFQEHNLIPVLSAYENIEYVLLLHGVPAPQRRERVRHVLELVGLDGCAERRPGEMSGGQQQRVTIARAIVNSPAVVLADEPTASLDSATGQSILDLLQRLNREQGITFVFSSHDPRMIGQADRIIALRDGRLASDLRP